MATPLTGTPLGDEVSRILESTVSLPLRHITGIIHLIDVNIDIQAIKVMNLDIVRDYENNYTDEVTVSAMFPIGTFYDIIYPNKENIEFSIKTNPVDKDKNDNVKTQSTVETRYIAKFISSQDGRVQPSSMGVQSTDSLDITSFITVDIQLIDKAMFLMRSMETGTICRQATPKEFLQTFLTMQLSNFQIGSDEKIIGIDLVDPDNTGQQEQIIIPHGTPLISVPDYTQKKICGIYNKGICSYIQHKVWYIYPRHDIDRNPKGNRLITIIVVPPSLLPSIDHSFRKDGEHYKILCTGRLSMDNNANIQQLKDGTGVRYTSSVTPLTEQYPSRSGNKAILSKSMINTEELGNKLKGKEQVGLYRSNYFTQNAFNEASSVSGLNSGQLQCLWENSYPAIIEPGTIAHVLYLDEKGETTDLKGTILKVHHSSYLPKKGLTQNTWTTNTAIFLWVKNNLDGNEVKQVKGGAEGWMSGSGSAGGGVGGSSNTSLSSLFGGNY